MASPEIHFCPGTLAKGFDTYSRTCLKRVFGGHKVHHILPYDSPFSGQEMNDLFLQNVKRFSISGVQEKYSVCLEKNKLRLANEGEQGAYILKPIPSYGKNTDQLPANEHLTMQIARQVYGIETAENALIFFQNGSPAYITKRFDVRGDGTKWGQDDFASLAGKTPQTHGEHYKYLGNYLELFELLKRNLPTYTLEAPKLFKLIVFNYLFSNGDAHLKNFSVIETPFGDYRLSPAYDLLNTSLHVDDSTFALDDGLLPPNLSNGKIINQLYVLADQAEIQPGQAQKIMVLLTSKSNEVKALVDASYLKDRIKRNYFQAYQTRLKRLEREF
jgi:serine/threonine-protein kinase HipA